ncbi:MAG TPA: hypothetical protein VLL08_22980 [Kineosporiaceae bacterium]|nr:hypothetical protein [Kineosporiaceae bacterium]
MYTVTVDVASPSDRVASSSDVDAICTELERLVTLRPWSGRVRRLQCLESPSGVILAVTTSDLPSRESARTLAEELLECTFAGIQTDGWSVQSFTVLTDSVRSTNSPAG